MQKHLIEPIVSLDEATHIYSDNMGNIYDSWSSRIKQFQEPFDEIVRSKQSAKKQLLAELKRIPTESEINKRSRLLVKSWKANNLDSTDHGTFQHKGLEKFGLFNELPEDENQAEMIKSIFNSYLTGYRARYFEQIIYSLKKRHAGTCDFAGVRVGGKNPVIDLKDYKTNKSKGIQYFSQYGKRFFSPLDFLEDCNYIQYCLQLSDYAFMLEEEHGFRIGRLNIIFIPFDNPMMHVEIPVPYMREEVKQMNNHLTMNKEIADAKVSGEIKPIMTSQLLGSLQEEENW